MQVRIRMIRASRSVLCAFAAILTLAAACDDSSGGRPRP
jgi:hypothetical protein